jgi:hypothetical protein
MSHDPEQPLSAFPSSRPLYVFLDEGGDLNFSPTGTRFFTLTSVLVQRPFPVDSAMTDLRFDLIEAGLDIEYFHASEDRQPTRDKVFAIIQAALGLFRVDSVIVEKRKTGPSLQADNRFYPMMMGYLLRYVVNHTDMAQTSEVIAITDRIPVNRKRQAVEKAVKTTLAEMLPQGVRYRVLHHDSKSAISLQVVDYFNWAIFRAWERGDRRSLDIVRSAVRSQLDIFQGGPMPWY